MPEHPALALIDRPNPRQGGIAFREMLYGHLLVAGNAYVEAASVGREPRELYALRPDRMRLVPGRDGWPEAYDYTVGGEAIRFRQGEAELPPILHLTLFHPVDDHYGLSPIRATIPSPATPRPTAPSGARRRFRWCGAQRNRWRNGSARPSATN